MHPELNIFWLIINSYKFFFISGYLIVILLSFIFLVKKWFDKNKIAFVLIFSSILSFAWARLFHYFLYIDIYKKNPELLFNLNMQWQAVIWGLLAWFLWIYITSKICKINHWQVLDIMSPFMWIWLIIWRIWCLLAWCCFGKETELPIWITFPLLSPVHKYQLSNDPWLIFNSLPVHPTQIYEMITWLIIFVVGIYLLKKNNTDWVVILSISIIYLSFRLIDNYFRAPALVYSVPNLFYPGLYLSLILICGVFLYLQVNSKYED